MYWEHLDECGRELFHKEVETRLNRSLHESGGRLLHALNLGLIR